MFEPSSDLFQKRKSSRHLENKQIRILLERHKEQILADVRSEIQKHELQAESDKRSIQELSGIIDSQRMEIDHTITRVTNPDEINFFFKKNYQNKNPRIPELQNEVNCINDSRDFKNAKSVRSGPSHVPSQPASFPPYRDPGGMLSRNDMPPVIWNTHGKSGNVFCKSTDVFFITLSRRIQSLDFLRNRRHITACNE